jgi:mono/diheme cytochrome c family protein
MKSFKNMIALMGGLFVSGLAWAQNEAATISVGVSADAAPIQQVSGFSMDQYIPWILAVTAIALAIVILFMGNLLSKVAISKFRDATKVIAIIFAFGMMNDGSAAVEMWAGFTTSQLNVILLSIIGFEVLIILYFANWLKAVVLPPALKEKSKKTAFWKIWWDKMNNSVEIEKEKDVQLDHDYDGIKELDNALPPWWVYGFYLTIVFAGIYVWRYHIAGTAPLQVQELKNEMAQAEIQQALYNEQNAAKVDENTITYTEDAGMISEGSSLFAKNCVACHAADGGGGTGPNLTDDYWKHGGDIKDIFRTISKGVPEMGMIAWGGVLTAKDVANLAHYVKSIKGTKTAAPKAPEGSLYQEKITPSTADSANVTPMVSMK